MAVKRPANAARERASQTRWSGSAALRAEPPDVKKLAILRAAAVLLRERGYERTRLDDIAKVLNVTKPTLYYYIKNKEEIIVAIQQMGFDEIMADLDGFTGAERTGAQVLRHAIVSYARWATTEFGVCVLRHFHLILSPANLAAVLARRRTFEARVQETIERGVRDGSLRPCDPWVVATAIFGAINWMAFWYKPRADGRDPADIGEAYCRVLMEGIGVTPRAPGKPAARARRASAAHDARSSTP